MKQGPCGPTGKPEALFLEIPARRTNVEACLTRRTWTPKVCRIMAFLAKVRGFGPLFYLPWGFRKRFWSILVYLLLIQGLVGNWGRCS